MRVLLLTEDPAEGDRLAALAGPRFQVECAASEALESETETARRYEIAVGPYFPPPWLAAAARLRAVVVPFAGIPRRTREALERFPNIEVYNSHYNADFTAEHAWALLLAAAKRLLPADRRLRANDWSYRHSGFPSTVLRGATLLLIGYGAIGERLAAMGKAFEMRVRAVRRRPGSAPGIDRLATSAELPELLPEADAVILALPDTEETAGIMGPREFGLLKEGAVLVNVGRAAAVDEDAFFQALRSGRLGAAALDTWWVYPRTPEQIPKTAPSRHPLGEFENLIFSPHRSSDVLGREEEQLRSVAGLLRRMVEGNAPPPVDREHWY